ncbi:hypothetical protein A1O3_02494 [Capronia epimyces CBS 606.96]|uniref:3-oxoacyl-[acyl-carrier protein] reductase n=1 Tax=Capronia epimyces CBS 606.96 TaxID=1182542 RepID=W9Y9C2_9EURO|nr:uncharacterized protein A1O3_02494 [Capronia epimyces CBS 606.96]EXJ89427.1 hypothetical protein A1O3_02494 [Capronia epimyces CBS 606.96]
MARFDGKVVVITGTSSGIGRATAKLFLDEGASVFGIDRAPVPVPVPTSTAAETETETATATVTSAESETDTGPRFLFHQCDLTAPNAISTAMSSCRERFGAHVDVLVNGAGVLDSWASADSVTDDDWQRVMAINLDAPVKLMRAVLATMKAQRSGVIVNVCSKASVSGASAGVAYTASKHALAGVTKNTAWRFRRDGIRCNAVCPGGVATNLGASVVPGNFDMQAFQTFQPVMNLHLHDNDDKSGVQMATPHIRPEDVAEGIAFLASDQAKMINGAMLPIDTAWSTI